MTATFWLLDAPDSLAAQSHRNPDGAGIGVFDPDGLPRVHKQPIAAWDDVSFASAARELTGATFVAHVRHASAGANSQANTHPFEQAGRLFAHNGVVQDLDRLDARLAELNAGQHVQGETDSERVFALLTAETERHGGDVMAGLTAAIGWISAWLPVYSLNFVLTTPTDLWALRYPAANELWVLERDAGGPETAQGLDARTARIHARSDDLAGQRSVIVASEPMDEDPGWRLLASGELLHVDRELTAVTSVLFPDQPVRALAASDLSTAAASSQRTTP